MARATMTRLAASRCVTLFVLMLLLQSMPTGQAQTLEFSTEQIGHIRKGGKSLPDATISVTADDASESPPRLFSGGPPLIVPKGISFSRTIKHLQTGSSYYLNLDENHCKLQDQYGDNDCHYTWGDTVKGNYTAGLAVPVNVGDTMHGDFKIDRLVPYEFTCPLCGDPCVLEVPVIEVNYTIDTPPCPIGPTLSHFVHETLGPVSPTDGIRTHLAGTVQMKRSNGDLIAEFSVEAYVK